jgi:hypothetical protein
VEIWPPGRWKREGKAKPAIQVITGSEAAKPAIPESGGHPNFNPNPENLSTKGKAKATSKPAISDACEGNDARSWRVHGMPQPKF